MRTTRWAIGVLAVVSAVVVPMACGPEETGTDDGGVTRDAGRINDAGQMMAGDSGINNPVDSGVVTPLDAGAPGVDSGTPSGDAGTGGAVDSGTNGPVDSGTSGPVDAGGNQPTDAGTSQPTDGGSSQPADAGQPSADAGQPSADAGQPPADAGQPPGDAGSGVDAGPSTPIYNNCTEGSFEDRTGQASTSITFGTPGPGFAYSPKCILVLVGHMANFSGNFGNHPLRPGVWGDTSAGSPNNPITATDSPAMSASFTFTTAGDYPYFCNFHGSGTMSGVIRVR